MDFVLLSFPPSPSSSQHTMYTLANPFGVTEKESSYSLGKPTDQRGSLRMLLTALKILSYEDLPNLEGLLDVPHILLHKYGIIDTEVLSNLRG